MSCRGISFRPNAAPSITEGAASLEINRRLFNIITIYKTPTCDRYSYIQETLSSRALGLVDVLFSFKAECVREQKYLANNSYCCAKFNALLNNFTGCIKNTLSRANVSCIKLHDNNFLPSEV